MKYFILENEEVLEVDMDTWLDWIMNHDPVILENNYFDTKICTVFFSTDPIDSTFERLKKFEVCRIQNGIQTSLFLTNDYKEAIKEHQKAVYKMILEEICLN